MVAKAQIAYPTNDDDGSDVEDEKAGIDGPVAEKQDMTDEPGEDVEDGRDDGLACKPGKVALEDDGEGFDDSPDDGPACMEGVPPDRCFDISPEEFCGDPYEQEGHIQSRQELGRKGEEAAVRYLRSRGYEIVKRNWFCRFGEADIIARDPEGTLCFIEVKTRQSVEAGLPEEAITHSKQSRYERIALCYMMVTDDWDDNESVRFDAIAICVTAPHRALLRHHKGCFNECF